MYCTKGHLHTDSKTLYQDNLVLIMSARDRLEQNVELATSHSGPALLFSLRTLRRIGRGQALLAWYEEELARDLGIPILTPVNIKGTFCVLFFSMS